MVVLVGESLGETKDLLLLPGLHANGGVKYYGNRPSPHHVLERRCFPPLG